MGIGLTTLPLRLDGRPVEAYASASHDVGLVSIPALGAVNLDQRLSDAVVELVAGLLGGESGRLDVVTGGGSQYGTLRFAGLAARDNARLLVGMIRTNQPTRAMARLSRSATAALGTGAYALTSQNIWLLAHDSTWPRLVAIAVLSMLIILASLVIAHKLWEQAPNPAARDRVVLFNIVTVTTLTIGIAALFASLFVLMVIAAAITIPPETLERQIEAPSSASEYVRLAWLVASVATVGGALGSLLESDEAVRDAAYRPRASGAGSEPSADNR